MGRLLQIVVQLKVETHPQDSYFASLIAIILLLVTISVYQLESKPSSFSTSN